MMSELQPVANIDQSSLMNGFHKQLMLFGKLKWPILSRLIEFAISDTMIMLFSV